MAQADVDQVYALHVKFLEAMVNEDVDFLMDHFTDDAVILAPGAPVARGSDEIRSWFEGAFAAATTESLDARNEDYYEAGDCIIETGEGTWTTRPKDGGESTTANIQWLAAWQRQSDGGWKIVRDIFNSD